MSKLAKLSLALSCFLPLFFIFGIENLCAACCEFSASENKNLVQSLLYQSEGFFFNAGLFSVWLLLFVIGIGGIIRFRKAFLKAQQLSKDTVILTKAVNITADYYFTYFSLFVISFFGVDPTQYKDVLIFIFLMVLIIWVYIANEMFFVNPVLNIMGYKSFSILYQKSASNTVEGMAPKAFEINVFSKEHLNRRTGEKLFLTFSPHDFSVCYPISKNDMSND
jgi:hypothetical protein